MAQEDDDRENRDDSPKKEQPRRRRRRDEDDDHNDESETDVTGGLIPYKNPMALAAYYTSIFGFLLPMIGSIIAIVLGFKGLGYAKQKPQARGQAHAGIGIGCGIIGVLFWGFIIAVTIIAIFANKSGH
jgi:hypothetical protein